MVHAEECWHRSLAPLIAEVREGMGDRPVYLTFDIDGIDPTHCPGTGETSVSCDYRMTVIVGVCVCVCV